MTWVVATRYEKPFEMVSRFPAEALGITADGEPVTFDPPACFLVANSQKLSDERGRFDSPEEAEEAAEELNREEAQGPLDPAFTERRERLKKLAPNFGSWTHQGPPAARWPVRPDRYLVHDGGVGWHPEESKTLLPTLDAVRNAIAEDESNVYSVVDLDTGDAVPFEREVVVRFPQDGAAQ